MHHPLHQSLSLIVLMLAVMLLATPARAQPAASAPEINVRTAPALLVVIRDPGCPYCARWERDIAPGYEASDDGKFAPVARRYRHDQDVAFIERVVFSPTFIMLVHGREVGRIVGYSGADLFWMQVSALIEDARKALQRSG